MNVEPTDAELPAGNTPGEGEAVAKPKRPRARRPRAAAVEGAGEALAVSAAEPAVAEASPVGVDASSVLPKEFRPEAPGIAPADASTGAPAEASADAPADRAAEGSSDAAAAASDKSRRRRRSRSRRDDRPGEGESLAVSADTPAVSRAMPVVDAQALFAEVVSGQFDGDVLAAADDVAPFNLAAAESTQAPSADATDSVAEDEFGAGTVDESATAGTGEAMGGADGESGDLGEAGDDGRRVLLPDPDAPKLHKVLAQSGVGSRRDLEAMIEAGRITVNGERAHTGQRISRTDRIHVDGKPVKIRIQAGKPRVLAYHKPAGEVVTHDDPQQRPTVFRRLPRLPHGKWQSVGRLDLNTEGLLLFTNAGDLANRLMHPRFGVEREYAVRVLGRLDDEARQRLLDGLEIEGQRAAFLSIEDGGGEGVNHWYRVVLNEGRNREVRRLFDAVGRTVSRLIRIRYGCVVLPRGLKRGAWVDLSPVDVDQLRALTGTAPSAERSGDGRAPRRGDRRGRDGDDRRPARSTEGRGMAGPQGAGPGSDRRPPRGRADRRERAEDGAIPNPLQQTFDQRALKESRRKTRPDAVDGRNIPNPLQQTFDQRAIREANRRPRRELGEDGPIPNPLQQTYDKRALMESRRGRGDDRPYDEGDDDRDDFRAIPNPLVQTFDRRFAGGAPGGSGPRRGGGTDPGAPRGKSRRGPGGGKTGGPGDRGPSGGKSRGGGSGQPDPMRTAVGYIGTDAVHGKAQRSGRGGSRGRRSKG